jgi:TPR repeat protein
MTTIKISRLQVITRLVLIVSIAVSISVVSRQAFAAPADPEKSLIALCEARNAEACVDIGIKDTDGVGIPINHARGMTFFETGCNLGNARACMLTAYGHASGRGTIQSLDRAIHFGKLACDGRNALGCNNLGVIYKESTTDVDRSRRLSVLYFQKSCLLDEGLGCFNFGRANMEAIGTTRDDAVAMTSFRRSCQLGYLTGCVNEAWMTEQGRGAAPNPSLSLSLYEKACAGGIDLGCANRDLMVRAIAASLQSANSGSSSNSNRPAQKPSAEPIPTIVAQATVTRADKSKAEPPGQPVAASSPVDGAEIDRRNAQLALPQELVRLQSPGTTVGSTPARLVPGSGLRAGETMAQSVARLGSEAEAGNAQSQYLLARMYDAGYGVSANLVEARRLFRAAATQGNAAAAGYAGRYLVFGKGGPIERTRGLAILFDGAEAGDTQARATLGLQFMTMSVENNDNARLPRALNYLTLAADAGSALAQSALGTTVYYLGVGDIPADRAKAIKYLRLGAAQGEPDSQYYLGKLLWAGDGITQNRAEAVRLYKRAADQGNVDAINELQDPAVMAISRTLPN